MTTQRLGGVAARGMLWIGASQGVRNVIQLGLMVALARVLSPEDFGLFGMAAVFVDLFGVISGLGVGAVVVGRGRLTEADLSTLFWVNFAVGLVLASVTASLAPLVALIYGESRLGVLMRVLAISFVVAPLGAVSVGSLERRLDFGRVAAVETLSMLVAGAVSLVLAVRGWGALSLVWLSVGILGARSVLGVVAAGWLPRLCFRLSGLGEAIQFGLNYTGNKILYYVGKHVDTFLLGKYIGATGLGYYRLASLLTVQPVLGFTAVAWRVSFPLFSSIQSDPNRVGAAYLRMLGWVTFVTFPILGWLFVSAPEVVVVLFGEQWQAAVPIVRIFCVVALLQAVFSTLDPVLLALGRSRLMFALGALMLPVVTVPLWFGLRWGVEGVAFALLVSTGMGGVTYYWAASRVLGLSARRYIPLLVWPTIAMLAVGIACGLTREILGGEAVTVAQRLLVQSLVGGVAGVVALWIGRPALLGDIMVAYRGVFGVERS